MNTINRDIDTRGTAGLTRPMMLIGIILMLVAAGSMVLILRHRSPQNRIRRELHELASLAGKQGEETLLQTARIGRRLGDAFADDAVVQAPPWRREIRGRAEITSAISQIRMTHRELRLSLRDITVTLDAAGRRADVVLTVLARGRHPGGDYHDAHEFGLTLERQGRRWLIAGASRVEMFE